MKPPRPHHTEVWLPDWEGFRRRLTTRGAFEQRHDDPKRDYGIGGVAMTFALVGEDRAVEWELLTEQFLPHTRERLRKGGPNFLGPTPGAVHWHRREPLYEGNEPSLECVLLPGAPCYADVGYTAGDDVYAAWAYGGLDGVFGRLRELL